MMNWLLILVLILLILNMVSGWRRGLVRMLYRLVSSVLSVLLALVLVLLFGSTIRESTALYDILENKISQVLSAAGEGHSLTMLLGLESAADGVARQVSIALFNVALFILLFILIRIILAVVGWALDLISELPLLHFANRLLGAGAGLMNGLLLVWAVLVILDLIGFSAAVASCTAQQPLLQILYDSNPFWKMIRNYLL